MSAQSLNIKLISTIVVVCFLAAPLSAAPAETVEPYLSQTMEIPYRSPSFALTLSLAGSIGLIGAGMAMDNSSSLESSGGMALIALGAIVGPSAGHLYTGQTSRALWFSLGRAAALSGGFLGAMVVGGGHGDETGETGAIVLAIAGGVTWLGLSLWDIVDAPRSAQRFNEKAHAFALAPMVLPPAAADDSDTPAYGLALAWRY